MNQLIRFIEQMMRRHDKSQRQFALDINISHGYLHNVLKGRQRAGTKLFLALSEATGASIDSLIELQDASVDDPPVQIKYLVSEEHQQMLIDMYNALPPDKQEKVMRILKGNKDSDHDN